MLAFRMGHGEILKNYLKSNRITVESFVDKLSKGDTMSRQTLYNWFHKNEFEEFLIQRIVKTGVVPRNIFNTIDNQINPNKTNEPMQKLIEQLEKRIETLEKSNEDLRRMNDHLMGGEGTMGKKHKAN